MTGTNQPTPPADSGSGTPPSGSLIDSSALRLLADHVERRGSAGGDPCHPFPPISDLLPPLACIPGLIDLAIDVLGGSPIAAARFRTTLGGFNRDVQWTRTWYGVLERHAPGRCDCRDDGGEPDPNSTRTPGHALFPEPSLATIAAAAVYAARDVAELAALLGGIEVGLGGADELMTLFDIAVLGDGDWAPVDAAYGAAARRARSGRFPDTGGFNPPGFEWPPHPGGIRGLPWPPPRPGRPGSPLPSPPPAPRVPQVPPGVGLIDGFEACVHDLIPRMHRRGYGLRELFAGSGAQYDIEGVSPDQACPGDTIEIIGTGFDGAEAVRFTGPGGRTVSAPPVTVAATRVTVIVPEWAMTGPLWLYIPELIALCHGHSTTVARPGTAGHFVAGRLRISRFHIDGERTCVPLATPATLHWATEPAGAIVVVTEDHAGTVRELYNGPAGVGSVPLYTASRGTRGYTIEVTNPASSCPPESRDLVVRVAPEASVIGIAGVELTQGIQRFSLASPAPATNNSISMIAAMDTVVRVFVEEEHRSHPGDRTRVTGVLRFRGRDYAPINGNPRGSAPFITAVSDPSRERIDDSINFLIPAGDAHGTGEIDITVFTAGSCEPGEARHRELVSWLDRPPLPVTIRRIAEPDTGDVLTEAEAMGTILAAFDRLPSPPSEVRLRPGVFSIGTFSAEANYCTEGGFYQLALSVAYEHNGVEGVWPDPHESTWIGLSMMTDCTPDGMMSWPWTSTCISVNDVTTAAHEIAHTVGLGHTKTTAGEDCNNLFQPVACHFLPNGGQLTDVVFDIRNNTLHVGAWDLQSYHAGYRYPHPIHWEGLRTRMDTRYPPPAPAP